MIIDPYAWSQVTITSLARVSRDTITVRLDKPPGYLYEVGQYAIVRGSDKARTVFTRQYSLISLPDDGHLELLIQLEPGGTASQWFNHDARAGANLFVSQPLGTFIVRETDGRVLLIAGKVGIAPFVPLLRPSIRPGASLIYSVSDKSEVCFSELMNSPAVRVIDTSSTKRIDTSLLSTYTDSHDSYFICGSKQFVDSITGQLVELGVASQAIHRESFTLQ